MDARARVAPAAVERRLRLRDDQRAHAPQPLDDLRDALDAAVGARAALRDDEEDGRARAALPLAGSDGRRMTVERDWSLLHHRKVRASPNYPTACPRRRRRAAPGA